MFSLQYLDFIEAYDTAAENWSSSKSPPATQEPNPEMYSEQDIEGKGIGCIAIQKIKKGTLILSEAPVLQFNTETKMTEGDWTSHKLTLLMEAYKKLGDEDKVEYMNLSNSFSEERERLSNRQFNSTLRLTEEELKVWQIFETNTFFNGVNLKMSRFNHACSPNAEYFWNSDIKKRDLRAKRNIREGEEITVTYIDMDCLIKTKRQKTLREDFNFHCKCEFCNKTDNEIQIETIKCEELMKLATIDRSIAAFSGIKAELECISKMYKIAKELKLIKNQEVLRFIVKPGFDVACRGVLFGSNIIHQHGNSIPQSDLNDFMNAANKFANVGEQISVVACGEDHSISREWKERKEDPIRCYKNQEGIE